MIKQVNFIKDTKKRDYVFKSIQVTSKIKGVIESNIPIEKTNEYYKNLFSSLGTIKINSSRKFKDADWVPIYLWYEFWCVSKKFKEIFEGKLKGYWYPTNKENYFIFLPDNCIDAIDKNKTTVTYRDGHLDKPYQYQSIDNLVFKQVVEEEYLFTIPELSGKWLVTEKFEKLVKENNLTGFQFYKEINYKRENGREFDWLRRKNYDEEGNVIND